MSTHNHQFPCIQFYLNDNCYQVVWNYEDHRLSINYLDKSVWTEIDYINTGK